MQQQVSGLYLRQHGVGTHSEYLEIWLRGETGTSAGGEHSPPVSAEMSEAK